MRISSRQPVVYCTDEEASLDVYWWQTLVTASSIRLVNVKLKAPVPCWRIYRNAYLRINEKVIYANLLQYASICLWMLVVFACLRLLSLESVNVFAIRWNFFTVSKIHRRIYFCASVRLNALIDSQVYVSYTFEYARERFRHLIYIFDMKNLRTRRRDANYVRSIALWCAQLRCLTVSSASGTTHWCDWKRIASADKRMDQWFFSFFIWKLKIKTYFPNSLTKKFPNCRPELPKGI